MCFHISIMTSNYPSTKANNLLSVSKAVAGCSSAAHLAHLFVVYLTNASVFYGIKYECIQFRYQSVIRIKTNVPTIAYIIVAKSLNILTLIGYPGAISAGQILFSLLRVEISCQKILVLLKKSSILSKLQETVKYG